MRTTHAQYFAVIPSSSMSGIVIREVTEEDYGGVVGIRTAYGGRDYLPGLYHNILKRHKGFVAILDGKMSDDLVVHACSDVVVKEMVFFILNGGLSIYVLVPRAGRVHQDYEGLGVYRKLDEFTMQVYKDVKYKAVSFHNRNATLMKKVEEGAYRITLNRKLKTYRTTLKSLKSDIQKRTLQNDVKHVDSDDLKGILSNTDVTKHMFSGDIFASCWTPLRIIPENTSHVFADNGVVFGSSVDDAEKAMISIGHPVLSSLGVSYVLDFYGLQRNDVADHIVKHLQNIEDYDVETLQLEIFSEDTDISFIQKVVIDLGFEVYDQVENEMHCIEQNLE